MGNLWQDVKYGVRMMRKNPFFAVVTALPLALGSAPTRYLLGRECSSATPLASWPSHRDAPRDGPGAYLPYAI